MAKLHKLLWRHEQRKKKGGIKKAALLGAALFMICKAEITLV